MGRTSIVVVSYNHRAELAACVHSLERAGIDPGAARLILVDNASTDGTAEMIAQELLAAGGAHTRGGLPAVFLRQGENQGFAGGCNRGIERALADGDDFVYLLNPDTEVEPGFLTAVLDAARVEERAALLQSLVLRHAESEVVNTYGNALHFLGFGYAAGDGRRLDDPEVSEYLSARREIFFASGAAVLVRLAALREIGLFNEDLFVYCEDLELGWRARLLGWRVLLVPASRVRHKYEFSRGTPAKYYWLERNRLWVVATCYRLPTLLLILPAFVAMELGMWAFAWHGGWWREKLRAYRHFLDPSVRARLGAARRAIQSRRAVGDRALAPLMTGKVVFPSVDPWPLTRVVNPVFALYWRIVRSLLGWEGGASMMNLIGLVRRRRGELVRRFDVRRDFSLLEESCVPSYVHPNIAASAVAWMRLVAALRLYRRYAAPGPVLDFGCASGELWHLMHHAGIDVPYHFCEENALLAAVVEEANPAAVRKDVTALPPGAYTAIFALDSLEHNENYAALVELLAGALHPEGRLILCGPTENSLYRLGRWISGFKGHYHKTTIQDIERAAARHLECVHGSRVPFGLPIFHVSVWRRKTS